MSEYEKLSLRLLTLILDGIVLNRPELANSPSQQTQELIRHWLDQWKQTTEETRVAINRK